ncbi:hypothetical protein VTI74DRAFT_9589 [Chaetomium olivicolor]
MASAPPPQLAESTEFWRFLRLDPKDQGRAEEPPGFCGGTLCSSYNLGMNARRAPNKLLFDAGQLRTTAQALGRRKDGASSDSIRPESLGITSFKQGSSRDNLSVGIVESGVVDGAAVSWREPQRVGGGCCCGYVETRRTQGRGKKLEKKWQT